MMLKKFNTALNAAVNKSADFEEVDAETLSELEGVNPKFVTEAVKTKLSNIHKRNHIIRGTKQMEKEIDKAVDKIDNIKVHVKQPKFFESANYGMRAKERRRRNFEGVLDHFDSAVMDDINATGQSKKLADYMPRKRKFSLRFF